VWQALRSRPVLRVNRRGRRPHTDLLHGRDTSSRWGVICTTNTEMDSHVCVLGGFWWEIKYISIYILWHAHLFTTVAKQRS
jgi:hypothetical protein